ncbi:hypothetical protein ABBQ38_006052 [Trebouxia sp. C0009 RCD-2024]
MVNVGLRAYIWRHKSVENQTARELWSLNGVTYSGYRDYVSHCKEHGFPEQQMLQPKRRPSSAGGPSVAASEHSVSSLASMSSQAAVPYSFAGMQHILEDTEVRVTVLKFANLSSDLLAYGGQDGVVRIAQLGTSCSICHVLKQHHKAISDLDWSLENTFLLSAGLDGSVSMWLAATGQLLRVFLTTSAALCARFHLVNQNLVMAGTESGIVQVFNCSTGKLVIGQPVPGSGSSQGGTSCSAMAVSNNLLFVADNRGVVYTWRCNIKNGILQSLALIARTAALVGTASDTASLVYSPYSSTARGQALLMSSLDGHLSLFKLADAAAGKLEVISTVEVPRAARKIRATFCPKVHITEPEYIVMGGEDSSVYIYDISKPSLGPSVITRLQGHMAPVVDVSWSYDETLLASCDCDGAVIIWKREKGH